MDEQHRKYYAGKYEEQPTDIDMKRYREGGHTGQMKEDIKEIIERLGSPLIKPASHRSKRELKKMGEY